MKTLHRLQRLALGLLAACASLLLASATHAQSVDATARALASKAIADVAAIKPSARPVCSNANENTGVLSPVGQHVNASALFWCPAGIVELRDVFSGVYSNANESKLTDPLPFKVTVAVAWAPWNATTSYAIGDTVTYATLSDGTNANPFWTATSANTNTPPSPGGGSWTAAASPTFTELTCNGGGKCQIPTSVDPLTGAVTTAATYSTDTLRTLTCPATGCFIYQKYLGVIYGAQRQPTNQAQNPGSGSYFARAAGVPADYTGTGVYSAANNTYGSGWAPAGIIGLPAKTTPTIAVRGDSRELGVVGAALTSWSLTSGGTGYQVGDVVVSPDTGASANGIHAPFKMVVTTVNAGTGAVLTAAVLNGGSYANPATTGQTNPTGAQAMVGGHGSGFSVTPTFSTTGGQDTVGDWTGARGPVARAATILGYPVVKFTVGGDRANLNVSASNGRSANLAVMGASTCVNALGINDVTGGATSAQIIASQVALATRDKAAGCKVYLLTTLPPNPQLTDGATTLGAQTVPANDAQRQAYNTWVRTLPSAAYPMLDGFLDLAVIDEDPTVPGKIQINASPCYHSCDGTHRVPASQGRAAVIIAPKLKLLAR